MRKSARLSLVRPRCGPATSDSIGWIAFLKWLDESQLAEVQGRLPGVNLTLPDGDQPDDQRGADVNARVSCNSSTCSRI